MRNAEGRLQRRVRGLWANLAAKHQRRNDGLNYTAWQFREFVKSGDLDLEIATRLGWRQAMKPKIYDEDDLSAEAITASLLAVFEKPRPKPKPKRKLVLDDLSDETLDAAQANPQRVKIATETADGVGRIERAPEARVVVVEGTYRELSPKTPDGYVMGRREYYEQQEAAFRERASAGSVTHSYDPFASLDERGEG
jgi:hypothetical protein